MDIKRSLREALWGVPKDKTVSYGKAIVSGVEQDYGKTPDISFYDQVEAFNGADFIQTACRNLASEIVGMRYETEQSKDYTVKINGKSAKEYIDSWNKKNNLDGFLAGVSQELIAYGNSFLIVTGNGLQWIPIDKVLRAVSIDKTTPISQEYWLKLVSTVKPDTIKDFVAFSFNVTSTTSPLGRGIMYPLMKVATVDDVCLLDARMEFRRSLIAAYRRQGFPPELITLKGAPETIVKAVDKDVHDAGTGYRIVTGFEGKIETVNLNRDKGFDTLFTSVDDAIIMSVGDPMLKATIAGNFSEASIRGITILHKNLIRQYQTVLKRQIERLWETVLKNGTYDPELAQVRLVFNEDVVAPKDTPKTPVGGQQ